VLGQDSLIATAVAVAVLVLAVLDRRGEVGPQTIVYVTAIWAPITVRRRLPLTAMIATIAVITVADLANWHLFQGGIVSIVAMGIIASAAYHRERWRAGIAAGSALWMLVCITVQAGGQPSASDLVMALGAGLVPVIVGYALRLHHDRAEQLIKLQKAEQREKQAEERAQLAREMHDVVGHHLSSIRLQAVGAGRTIRGSSPASEHAFATIADISQEALIEVRHLLDILRTDTVKLADLTAIAERLSENLDVTVTMTGELDEIPTALQHSAYRIAQEALTNVVRHSGADKAIVRVTATSRALSVVVDDNGKSRPEDAEPSHRNGLTGMADRVRVAGGTFTAGPQDPHGWRVAATFPIGSENR
jgi:signal transduction histidine kinase